MEKNLCFGCYEPTRKDLIGKNCQRRRIYCESKENYPTRPHGYNPKSKEPKAVGSQSSEEKLTDSGRKISCTSITIYEDLISMYVVPVKVNPKEPVVSWL